MTGAQKDYLARVGIDPWSLEWDDAKALGFPSWGISEAAVLPDGLVLLANGVPGLGHCCSCGDSR